MEAAKPKLVVLGGWPELSPGQELLACSRFPGVRSEHPCEHCKCCACHRLCTKCRENCRPMKSSLIPVIYCPDFVDLRTLGPVRYLYRSDCGCEYRLRLPGTR